MDKRTKVCSPTKGCGIEKDLSEFHKNGTYKSGTIQYRFICIRCENKRKKRWYQNNQNREKEKAICYRQNNRQQRMLTDSKRRAREKGFEHNIELEDIVIPEYCPILKIKIENNNGKGFKTAQFNSPSLDRIDNNKGYIKGNIRVISWRANHLKGDSTVEERRLLYEDDLRLEQQQQKQNQKGEEASGDNQKDLNRTDQQEQ